MSSEWIEWDGGEQPVADDVMVYVRLRGPPLKEMPFVRASFFHWERWPVETPSDIMAYKVKEEKE